MQLLKLDSFIIDEIAKKAIYGTAKEKFSIFKFNDPESQNHRVWVTMWITVETAREDVGNDNTGSIGKRLSLRHRNLPV